MPVRTRPRGIGRCRLWVLAGGQQGSNVACSLAPEPLAQYQGKDASTANKHPDRSANLTIALP